MQKAKTIICDIDGCIVEHYNDTLSKQMDANILRGSLEKVNEWDKNGYNIILITGRRESQRQITEQLLRDHGVFYDQLIMGVGGGDRILINDRKPDGRKTAFAFNLNRNEGIRNVEI
jgi:ribonucleotide monophosphatase NagD (HAD superfamily)